MSGKYDDIIRLPHPISKTHRQMPLANRAAQFSPFAALTGFGDAIAETGRLTDEQSELGEDLCEQMFITLTELRERLRERPRVEVVYFEPDQKKTGGRYACARGRAAKIDEYERLLTLDTGEKISLDLISRLELPPDEE